MTIRIEHPCESDTQVWVDGVCVWWRSDIGEDAKGAVQLPHKRAERVAAAEAVRREWEGKR